MREVKPSKGALPLGPRERRHPGPVEPIPFFEDVEVWITAPRQPGKYLAWTINHPGAERTGVSRFVFSVKDERFRLRKVSYVGTWRLRLQRWFASPNPYDLPRYPSLSRTGRLDRTAALGPSPTRRQDSAPPDQVGGRRLEAPVERGEHLNGEGVGLQGRTHEIREDVDRPT